MCQGKPDEPTIVVFGVNSSVVPLNWKTCGGNDGETIRSVYFLRQRPGSIDTQEIASREANGAFNMIDPFKDNKKYKALLQQQLNIFDVQKDEEYIYTLEVDFRTSNGELRRERFRVSIDVKG